MDPEKKKKKKKEEKKERKKNVLILDSTDVLCCPPLLNKEALRNLNDRLNKTKSMLRNYKMATMATA